MSWWNEISLTEQTLYIIAAAATVILLIQTVLSMLGIESDSQERGEVYREKEAFSVPDVGFFSIRGLLSFFSIGAWVTIVAYKASENYFISFSIGAAAGLLTMFLLAKGFCWAQRLGQRQRLTPEDIIGMSGEVYMTIPPRGEGTGTVSISTQDDRLDIFSAIAYEDNKIAAGKAVRVVDVLEDNLVLVESDVK